MGSEYDEESWEFHSACRVIYRSVSNFLLDCQSLMHIIPLCINRNILGFLCTKVWDQLTCRSENLSSTITIMVFANL